MYYYYYEEGCCQTCDEADEGCDYEFCPKARCRRCVWYVGIDGTGECTHG